jgi:hypothetical protein
MGTTSSKDKVEGQTELNINEMIAQYSYNLSTDVMLIFNEEEKHQQNQLIIFPHIKDTNLNSINAAYEQLQKDQKDLKKNKDKVKEEVIHLTTRIKNTKNQINDIFKTDSEKNTDNLTKMGNINSDLTNLKEKFSSLMSEYSIKRITPLDISNTPEESSVKAEQKVEQKVEQKIEQNPKINTVINPVININTAEKQKSSTDDFSTKNIINLLKIGGGNIEFKDDPVDYIFEKFSKKELNKIGNDWNLPKTNKYKRDELINILKLMLKYKNNIKINKKDLKLLATSIKIKRTDKGYNKNKINTNLINVPTI